MFLRHIPTLHTEGIINKLSHPNTSHRGYHQQTVTAQHFTQRVSSTNCHSPTLHTEDIINKLSQPNTSHRGYHHIKLSQQTVTAQHFTQRISSTNCHSPTLHTEDIINKLSQPNTSHRGYHQQTVTAQHYRGYHPQTVTEVKSIVLCTAWAGDSTRVGIVDHVAQIIMHFVILASSP